MTLTFIGGEPVSDGFGEGEIYILNSPTPLPCKREVGTFDIGAELEVFDNAIDRVSKECAQLDKELKDSLSNKDNSIFEVYLEILKDSCFIQDIKHTIVFNKYFAEKAVSLCMEGYISQIADSDSPYFKQRVADLNDLKLKLVNSIIGGISLPIDNINEKHIIVVKDLNPSLAVQLGRKKVAGIAAETGAGYLSHGAIILRGLGIPALNGIDFQKAKGFNKEYAVIDTCKRVLIVDPVEAELKKYRSLYKQYDEDLHLYRSEKIGPIFTADGYPVAIQAGISSFREIKCAKGKGFDGLGLVRTEMLFINSKSPPDYKRQYFVYKSIAKAMYPTAVTIRTVDIGDDKIPAFVKSDCGNENSGLRGLERSLADKERFIIQIKSIMHASIYGNISMAFPMVKTAEELKEAKKLVESARLLLNAEGIKDLAKLKLGSFIETRQALDNIDDILKEIDFICVGTNDLLYHITGTARNMVSKGNTEYFSPEFLGAIKYCIDCSNRENKPVYMCGGMAENPVAALILIGFGVHGLCVYPHKALQIRNIVSKLSLREIKELSQKVIECENIDNVQGILGGWIKEKGILLQAIKFDILS